jgi:hypothetical protein
VRSLILTSVEDVMTKYPQIFPAEAAQVLAQAAISPKTADKKAIAAASWDMVGFALGQFLGEPSTLFGGEPESFNGLLTSRDPAKGRKIEQQVLGLLSLAYGASLFNKDAGIPAVLLAVNALIVKEWPSLEDAYWTAKGV